MRHLLVLTAPLLFCRADIHKLHITHARMAVEGDAVVMRIRFFKHDLEDAVSAYHLESTSLDPSTKSDSLFLDYFEDRFTLVSSEDTLFAAISASGEDRDIWWYELSFNAPSDIAHLEVTNRLLFELFDDQKNIVYVTHFPSEQRETLYFVAGAGTYVVDFILQ